MSDSEKIIPPLKPAATVILLRPTKDASNIEVLLLLRAKEIKFAGGAWVFPGGRIEENELCQDGTATLEAARTAAARETAEEAGLRIDAESLIHYSHWNTPPGNVKRFSTCFLLGALDRHQATIVDQGEIVEHRWLTPQAALRQHHDGKLKMLPPTFVSLTELAECTTIEDAMNFASSRDVPVISPVIVSDETSFVAMYKEDAGYATANTKAPGARHRMIRTKGGWLYEKDF